MPKKITSITIFISSPGDVNDERKIALDVIDSMQYFPSFRGKVSFNIVAWDKPGAGTAMRASMTPQEAINRGLPRPSECDIVIVLFWSRMGTPFIDTDGIEYESGTHWELLDALASDYSKDRTLIYRRTEEKKFGIDEEEDRIQNERLVDFLDSDFFSADGRITRGINHYEKPNDFWKEFMVHLAELVKEILDHEEAGLGDRRPAPSLPKDDPNILTTKLKKWDSSRSPFPGLKAFTEQESDIFFGRGIEVDKLVETLRASQFVAVIAPSGSGKSSLVSAGLIPRLRANTIEGSKDWYIIERFTPSDNPIDYMFDAIVKRFPNTRLKRRSTRKKFIRTLYKLSGLDVADDSYSELLDEIEDDWDDIWETALDGQEDWVDILFFVDQFEELFTLADKADARAFITLLDILTGHNRIRVIVTMRADFYTTAVQSPQLAKLFHDGSFPLTIPSRDALRQMIEKPAERAGIEFAPDLVDHILVDVGNEPGNLALMAYALDELYKIDDDGKLTSDEYESIGGVKGAIGTRAEEIWSSLDMDESILYQVFIRLIYVDENGKVTSRRMVYRPEDEVPEVLTLIARFVNERLLTLSYDKQTNARLVRVAHEAILREWGTLSHWVHNHLFDIIVVQRMQYDAKWWDYYGRNLRYLPLAGRINEFMEATYNLQLDISPDNEDYRLVYEFIHYDERNWLIQTLMSGRIDIDVYKNTIIRLHQLGGDIAAAHIAMLRNVDTRYELEFEPTARIQAAQHSARLILTDNRSFEALIHTLQDEDYRMQIVCVEALAEVEDQRICQPLIDFYDDTTHPIVTIRIIQTFSKLKNPIVIEPLIEMLDRPDKVVRLESLIALVKLGDERAIPLLIEMLWDEDYEVCFRSISAFRDLGDERAVPPLIEMLKHPNNEVQLDSIFALDEIGDERAVTSLIEMLEHPDKDIRLESISTLGNLGDERAVIPLINILTNEDKDIRLRAILALGLLEDSRAINPLRDLLPDEDVSVRESAEKVLRQLGDDEFLDQVTAEAQNQKSLDPSQNNDITDLLNIIKTSLGSKPQDQISSPTIRLDILNNSIQDLGKLFDNNINISVPSTPSDFNTQFLSDSADWLEQSSIIQSLKSSSDHYIDLMASSDLILKLNQDSQQDEQSFQLDAKDADAISKIEAIVATYIFDSESHIVRDFADEETIIILGRQLFDGETNPQLRDNILATLRAMEHPTAQEIVAEWDEKNS